MRTFVTSCAAVAVAAGLSVAASNLVEGQTGSVKRQRALQELLANPVGPLVLDAVAPGFLDDAGVRPAVSAIFDPSTPMEEVERRMDRLTRLASGLRFQVSVTSRWGDWSSPSDDIPVNLTYSFPPDGTPITNFAGEEPGGTWVVSGETTSSMFDRWDTAFMTTDGAAWKPFFRAAFDRWEDLTGNRYIETTDDGAPWPDATGPFHGFGTRGDLRITSALDDGPGGTLAFNFFPEFGDMLLDSADLVGTRFLNPAGNQVYLRNVIMHEHGHGMGMSHVCPREDNKLMEPFVSTVFDGPQKDDRLGAQRLYGDTFELNNSIGASIPPVVSGLSISNPNPQSFQNLSIHNSIDTDHFRFTTSAGAYSLSVTVSPTTGAYLTGPQTQQCNTGTSFNPALGVDLQVDVLDSLGVVMQSKNAATLGSAESINNLQLADPDTYHIRVKRADGTSFNNVQGYSMTVVIQPIGTSADISGDGCVDGNDLAILLAQWGPNQGAPSDLNGDGVVNGIDLAGLLAGWAPCG